jgi:hypothetical protein
LRIERRVTDRTLSAPEVRRPAQSQATNTVPPVVERKLRRRQLTDDGNWEIAGRDLREKNPPVGRQNLFERASVPRV